MIYKQKLDQPRRSAQTPKEHNQPDESHKSYFEKGNLGTSDQILEHQIPRIIVDGNSGKPTNI